MSTVTRTEYAFDFGDELEDFTIDGGARDDAEALRRSAEITRNRPPLEPDLYAHRLVSRTLTVTQGDWSEVAGPLETHDAACLISVEPS